MARASGRCTTSGRNAGVRRVSSASSERPTVPLVVAELGPADEDALGGIVVDWESIPTWELVRGGAISDLPPARWLLRDVIVQGGLTLLWGPPGAAKTVCALDWAACVAAGIDWFGHKTYGAHPVIYVLAEGVGGVWGRMQAWMGARGLSDVPDGFLLYPTHTQLWSPGGVQTLEQLTMLRTVEAERPALVVFDTLARNMPGGNENATVDMNIVVATIDEVRRRGAAVLMVHHGSAMGARERGNTALAGAADTNIQITKDDENPDASRAVEMRWHKQKDGIIPRRKYFGLETLSVDTPFGTSVALELSAEGSRTGDDGMAAHEIRSLRALVESELIDTTDGGETRSGWHELCEGSVSISMLKRAITTLRDEHYAIVAVGETRQRRYFPTRRGYELLGLDPPEDMPYPDPIFD